MFSSGCMVGHLVHNKHTDWEQSRGSHPSAVGRSWPCCSIKIYCQELNFVNCVHNMHPYDIITLCTLYTTINWNDSKIKIFSLFCYTGFKILICCRWSQSWYCMYCTIACFNFKESFSSFIKAPQCCLLVF